MAVSARTVGSLPVVAGTAGSDAVGAGVPGAPAVRQGRGLRPIDPRFLSAERWMQETGFVLREFGPLPAHTHEANWKVWGDYVCSRPAIAALQPALPENFTLWQAWATSFNRSVEYL